MEKLSFFEKLGILFSNIFAHPIFICLLLLPVLLIIFNKKITRKIFVFIYIGVLLIVLFVGNTVIFDLFDNMVDGLFMTLYFPNFITLFIVEVISFIITLITFFKKVKKVNKVINITSFAVIQTLFCLVLTVIKSNNIDVYKENALYSNSDVLTIMQLFMGMFALQVISLVVIYLIDKITLYLDSKDEISPDIQEKFDYVKDTHNQRTPIITPFSYKEPDVVITPQKPLDKSLIKEKKIDSIDLEEEISKEKVLDSKSDVISFSDFKLEYPLINGEGVDDDSDDEVLVKSEEKFNETDSDEEVNEGKKEDIIKPDLLKSMDDDSLANLEEKTNEVISDEKVDEVKREDIIKPDLLKPMEDVSDDEVLVKSEEKFNETDSDEEVNEGKKEDIIKPDLLKSMDDDSLANLEEKTNEVISDEKVDEVKREDIIKPDLLKPMEDVSDDEVLVKSEEKFNETNSNERIKEIKKDDVIKPDLFKPMESLEKPLAEKESTGFGDFKLEYPDAKTKDSKEPISSLGISDVILDNKESIKPTTVENDGIDLDDVISSDNGDEIKTENNTLLENVSVFNEVENVSVSNEVENVSDSEESTELIVNLKIINFEKMVDVISKLKRVYTL